MTNVATTGYIAVEDKLHQRARRVPDTVALTDGNLSLTYRQLDRFTDSLARQMRARGVGPERVVAVDPGSKLEAAVALVAVLKAGGGYLALAAGAPPDWKQFVLADSNAALLLLGTGVPCPDAPTPALRLKPPFGANPDDLPPSWPAAPPEAVGCVVYTSGTTGRPKGVCLARGPLSNHLDRISEAYGLRPDDRCLQFSPVHADTAVEQVLTSLILGATVVCNQTLSAADLIRFIVTNEVTVAHLATGYWHLVVQSLERRAWPATRLRQVMVGGDRMSPRAVALWQERTGVPIVNAYGPTEAMITPNAQPVTTVNEELGVPIGEPCGDRVGYVLDGRLCTVPGGTNGELYLGGRMLARGYIGRPGLTARSFVADPFSEVPGSRMYRTGDVVRSAGGNVYFIGRGDNQVKHRGFRVELAEIDAVLARHAAVRECAVVAREDRPGQQTLVGYVVRADPNTSARELKEYLAARLPEHMVPETVSLLDALPLTTNSKIDRRALRGQAYRPNRPDGGSRPETDAGIGR